MRLYNTNAMKKRKLLSKRPKAKNGQKRQTVIKHILLPEELVVKLQLYKQAYSDVLNQKVSWEQMLHRWMENIGRFDPDVKLRVEAMKTPVTTPEQVEEPVVSEQVEQPAIDQTFHEDPTEGEVWDRKYFFEKDGVQVDAKINVKGDSFSAKIGNRFYGVKELRRKEWVFMNDRRVEITEEQARVIAQKIVQHKVDMYYQHAAEAVRAKEKEWNEEYDKMEKLRSEQQES